MPADTTPNAEASVSPAVSVVDLIKGRAATGSEPGKRDDPWKLALAVEGGAMRGVISAAMTVGLEQLGFLNAFDDVFGSSVGSINGAAFISGQAAMCVASYYNEMTRPDFLDFRQLLRGRPALSLKFVLDVSAEVTRPLNWDAVVRSPIRLHPIATSLETMKWTDLGKEGFTGKADLKEALRASSQYPVLAGPPVVFRGKQYMDASLSLSIPAHAALTAGASHVLVLRTRPRDAVRSKGSVIDRFLIAPRLGRIDPRLVRLHLDRQAAYDHELNELREFEARGVAYSINPNETHGKMSAFDRSRERTLAAAQEGVRSVYRVFDGREPFVAETLRAY